MLNQPAGTSTVPVPLLRMLARHTNRSRSASQPAGSAGVSDVLLPEASAPAAT
jgi:hypothetical protein